MVTEMAFDLGVPQVTQLHELENVLASATARMYWAGEYRPCLVSLLKVKFM
jgi:hypothetical protein